MDIKHTLRDIYEDASQGRLSQEEALEKIKAVKLQKRGAHIGTLLLTPIWQADDDAAPSGARTAEYAEHHVVLCELSNAHLTTVERMIPHVHCVSLHAEEQQTIAQR